MNYLSTLEIQRFRDQEDTELHKASYEGDLKKVNALLRNCEVVKNINQRNRLGCSPLRLATTGTTYLQLCYYNILEFCSECYPASA